MNTSLINAISTVVEYITHERKHGTLTISNTTFSENDVRGWNSPSPMMPLIIQSGKLVREADQTI